MKKLIEYTFFILIYFIVLVFTYKAIDLTLEQGKAWNEIILTSLVALFILLIAKTFGFLDKKKKSSE